VPYELRPAPEDALVEAVRKAAETVGLGDVSTVGDLPGAGWRAAALLEGVGGDPVTSASAAGSQTRSPRSMLGATRA
jgi:hypothetical protein